MAVSAQSEFAAVARFSMSADTDGRRKHRILCDLTALEGQRAHPTNDDPQTHTSEHPVIVAAASTSHGM